MSDAPADEPRRWLDDPANVRRLIHGFWAACALLIGLDLLDVLGLGYQKQVHFPWEGWFGFYGIYGFVACVALVESAKLLRKLVRRPADYWEDQA